MRALIVYESLWGNTEKVARAIAQGVSEFMTVEMCDVSDASITFGPELGLIVAGGPTHAFTLSRRSTRSEAHSQGAPKGDERIGLREWLDALPSDAHPQQVATFDTRVDKVRRLPGSAAKSAARSLRRHGYPRASHVESFYVSDTAGPLLDGELERARAWGRTLAQKGRPRPGYTGSPTSRTHAEPNQHRVEPTGQER